MIKHRNKPYLCQYLGEVKVGKHNPIRHRFTTTCVLPLREGEREKVQGQEGEERRVNLKMLDGVDEKYF